MNKCPNCGRKLSPFYFKQCCPDCGVNLLYFNLTESLESDRAKAEREISAVRRFLYGIKISTIGSIWGIFKITAAVLQILLLLIPVYYIGGDRLSLLTLIKSLISPPGDMTAGDVATQQILADRGAFFAVLTLILVALFAIVSVVFQLFSYTKNGAFCNFAAAAFGVALFLVFAIIAMASGAVFAGGFYIETAVMVVGLVIGAPLEKNVRKRMNEYDAGAKSKAAAQADTAVHH